MLTAPVELEIVVVSVPRATTRVTTSEIPVKISRPDTLLLVTAESLTSAQVLVTDPTEQSVGPASLLFLVVVILVAGSVLRVLLRRSS
jgi:hypothetical protein